MVFVLYEKIYLYNILYQRDNVAKIPYNYHPRGDARRFGGASGLYQSCHNWRLAKRRETLKNESSFDNLIDFDRHPPFGNSLRAVKQVRNTEPKPSGASK